MGFDTVVADQLTTAQLAHHTESMALTGMADRNATQGLTVVNTALIQQQGSVSDDAGLIAALQTAAGAPQQGDNARSGKAA